MKDKKQLSSKDIITETTLHDILLVMNDRITHIEDAVLDYRKILIKLVRQSNQVVSFLKTIEEESDTQYIEEYGSPPPSFEDFIEDKETIKEIKNVHKLVDEFIEKNKDLKELEDELEKNKDKIVPGVHGES